MQFALPSGATCVVDVMALGADPIRKHLGPVLQDNNVIKLMYDCRMNAQALQLLLGIRLREARDMQLYIAFLKQEKGHRLMEQRLGVRVVDRQRCATKGISTDNLCKRTPPPPALLNTSLLPPSEPEPPGDT